MKSVKIVSTGFSLRDLQCIHNIPRIIKLEVNLNHTPALKLALHVLPITRHD